MEDYYDPEPMWPVIVFETDSGPKVYSRYDWYDDTELCSKKIWQSSTCMVDSYGNIFSIEHKIIPGGCLLFGITLPPNTAKNVLFPTGDKMAPYEFIERLSSDPLWNSEEVLGLFLEITEGLSNEDFFDEAIDFLS